MTPASLSGSKPVGRRLNLIGLARHKNAAPRERSGGLWLFEGNPPDLHPGTQCDSCNLVKILAVDMFRSTIKSQIKSTILNYFAENY